jgi:hypothetical protein
MPVRALFQALTRYGHHKFFTSPFRMRDVELPIDFPTIKILRVKYLSKNLISAGVENEGVCQRLQNC